MKLNTKFRDMDNMEDIRMLLGKYFDATISSDEMERLDAYADTLASGALPCLDQDTAESLNMIFSLRQYGEFVIGPTAAIPEGLEEMIDSHISKLAADTRRSFLRRRLLRFSAAAAAAGILAMAGISYVSQPSLPSPDRLPMMATVSEASNPDSTHTFPPATDQSSTDSAEAAAIPPLHSPEKYAESNPPSRKAAAGDMEPAECRQSLTAKADKALEALPDISLEAFSISEEAFRVTPPQVTIPMETAGILRQPLSTLSQSINNIYESVGMVSEALSGVSLSLEAVSSSLCLLSDPL